MKRSLAIKLGLIVIIGTILVLYNLHDILNAPSRAQTDYAHWLMEFETSERSSDKQDFRKVTLAVQGNAVGAMRLNPTKPGVGYTHIERILELIRESNVLTWGKRQTSDTEALPDQDGVLVTIEGPNYQTKIFAPQKLIEKNIAFQNFLKLMQLFGETSSKT